MAATHETQNTFWRSRLKESAYGTRRAHGDDYVRILTTDKSPWSKPAGTADDGAYAHGSDRAENVWNTTRDASKTFPADFNFTDIGYALLDALGSVSTSGAGADKTHVFTPQNANTSRQLPSRTYGQKLGGLWLDIFTSGVTGQLTISGARNGRLSVEQQVTGNGAYEEDPSSYAQPSLTSGLEFGYANQCTVTLDDGASINPSYTCLLESWSWVLNNNLEADGYRACGTNFIADDPESGVVRSEALMGARDYKFNFEYRLDAADDTRGLFNAGTIITVTNTITSPTDIPTTSTPYSLTIEHTRARILTADEIITNGQMVGMRVTCDLLSSGGSIPLTATLVNNTASYLS